jgi:hypothetical protein
LRSLIITEGKRDTPSTAYERQAGGLAVKAENPRVVLHGSASIIVDAAARDPSSKAGVRVRVKGTYSPQGRPFAIGFMMVEMIEILPELSTTGH